MFWKKKPSPSLALEGKIEVFVRHCLFSKISQHKKRFPHFSREICDRNLRETLDPTHANLTFWLDLGKEGKRDDHFIKDEAIVIREGSEAGSFLRLLDHVLSLSLHPETILYFLEDDYLHRPGWIEVLKEGFTVPGVDYVTLYDHRDKYFDPSYRKLESRLFATPSCHWRTTPSTTQTFAVKMKTLLRDERVHRKYSEGETISRDHAKFCRLQKRGAMLISSIPGWSTHCEPAFASPGTDWERLFTPTVVVH